VKKATKGGRERGYRMAMECGGVIFCFIPPKVLMYILSRAPPNMEIGWMAVDQRLDF
jgi:hypothetical protein